jgi:hypothetical protein
MNKQINMVLGRCIALMLASYTEKQQNRGKGVPSIVAFRRIFEYAK